MELQIVLHRCPDGGIPFAHFLEQFASYPNDKPASLDQKARALARINSVLLSAAQNQGQAPGKYHDPLPGYPFGEIKVHFKTTQHRMHYFCYRTAMIVLLNGYSKPDHYEKAKKRVVDKQIALEIAAANACYHEFMKDPSNNISYDARNLQ